MENLPRRSAGDLLGQTRTSWTCTRILKVWIHSLSIRNLCTPAKGAFSIINGLFLALSIILSNNNSHWPDSLLHPPALTPWTTFIRYQMVIYSFQLHQPDFSWDLIEKHFKADNSHICISKLIVCRTGSYDIQQYQSIIVTHFTQHGPMLVW